MVLERHQALRFHHFVFLVSRFDILTRRSLNQVSFKCQFLIFIQIIETCQSCQLTADLVCFWILLNLLHSILVQAWHLLQGWVMTFLKFDVFEKMGFRINFGRTYLLFLHFHTHWQSPLYLKLNFLIVCHSVKVSVVYCYLLIYPLIQDPEISRPFSDGFGVVFIFRFTMDALVFNYFEVLLLFLFRFGVNIFWDHIICSLCYHLL